MLRVGVSPDTPDVAMATCSMFLNIASMTCLRSDSGMPDTSEKIELPSRSAAVVATTLLLLSAVVSTANSTVPRIRRRPSVVR